MPERYPLISIPEFKALGYRTMVVSKRYIVLYTIDKKQGIVFGINKMNTALIFAGGTCIRMSTRAEPKQFLEMHGKPVIIYTLENFEMHPEIDDIVVVCIENWINELRHMIKRYELVMVSQIVVGGAASHESVYKGLHAISERSRPDAIVLIHDGVRPLINDELISTNIAKVKECGTAITIEAATESVVRLGKDDAISEVPPRWEMYLAKSPQSFRYGLIWDLYKRAHSEGVATIDSSHLCSVYGVKTHTVISTPNNIKIPPLAASWKYSYPTSRNAKEEAE